ncbi:MAG: cyclase [Planctomycetes bacterium]|nr:cyclase [Planctomycetota bacterium]
MIETLEPYRIVDLSKKVVPGEGDRRCEIRPIKNERSDDYYCELDLMTHLGTHLEAPYHFDLKWKDIAAFPASAFMGRCVMLKITDIEPGARIMPEHLDSADGGRVRKGDIVIVETPYHLPPFSFPDPDKEIRPHVNSDMGQWLVDKGIKCIGFADSVDIETRISDFQDFHRVAMGKDITFIEVLENLDELKADVFFLISLPMYIVGMDSCPVRVVAIEGIPGFDK